MKINEMIRQKRMEKHLTQEDVARYLGVSTPAVNKWEKGVSYPDISLLPPLARLLGTDLNTLLSFQEDLSEKEIVLFINHVSEIIDKEGFEAGYLLVTEKIREYPACDVLIFNAAALLDGALLFGGSKKEWREKYAEEIEALYRRAARSDNTAVREQAQACLISKVMGRKEYEQAQEILNTVPKRSPVDREQLQANIYIAQGELENAAKLIEGKLLSATNEIHACLMTLMEIALKEERMEDAAYIAEVDKKGAEIFDLWEFNSYAAHFQLYSAKKDRVRTLKILIPMIKSLTKKWEISKSPLYRHIKTKEVDKTFGPKLQKTLLQEIHTDKEMEFLKDSPELRELEIP